MLPSPSVQEWKSRKWGVIKDQNPILNFNRNQDEDLEEEEEQEDKE